MNKTNHIKLVFDKATTRLAYYPYGKEVYEQQVKPNIDFSNDITYIEFPDQIVKAASSFVQGFFEDIISNIGYEAIEKKIVILSKNESLKSSIKTNLIF
ncbi:MAG: DUF4325 domain-containing protein [Clostridia bacterium]|nr:DUF4325 domain-containing protein [Clostridia bacterium]